MEYVIRYKDNERISLLLWIGLLLYSAGYQMLLYLGESIYFKVFYALGVLFTLISLFAFLRVKNVFNVNVLYPVLLLWCLIMYLRSGAENYFSLYNYGTISFFGIIMPSLFIIPFMKSAVHIGRFVSLFFIATFWVPLFLPVGTGFVQSYLESYAVFGGFVFLTNKYHNKKDIYIAFVALFLALLVATITARRNLMLTFGLYIMFGSLFFIFNGKLKSLEIKIISILSSILLLFAVYYFYMSERSGAFSMITTRATENTREEVFMAFAVDMFNVKDLTIGRGIFGSYYNPGVDIDKVTGESMDDRGNIECGYLQCILKGGIIYLVLYVAIFVIAILKGRKSNNQFVKGCCIIILVQLIDMFPFGIHDFNSKTFIIWMALAVCMNPKLKNMTDDEIKECLYNRKNILLAWQKK